MNEKEEEKNSEKTGFLFFHEIKPYGTHLRWNTGNAGWVASTGLPPGVMNR